MNKTINMLILLLVFGSQSWAQELTYKEIKTIKKSIVCNSKTSLSITGERTFLVLETWEKNYAEAKVEVISKHTSKSKANADLEKVNVVLEKKGRKIIYSNALRIKSPNDKPESNLSIYVRLRIPESMDVDISNAFGEIDIKGTYGVVTSSSDFTTIDIHEFDGTSRLDSKYGDLNIESYKGGLFINADRSNLSMTNMTGNADIEAQYGEIDIYFPIVPVAYKVKVSYSPMSIYIPEGFNEKISLSCENCDIISKENNVPITYNSKGSIQTADIVSNKQSKNTSSIYSEIENIHIHTYQSTQKSN